MTRFLLSLEQAVDTVVAALESAQPGEIYVPRAPSASIINIAKALIGTAAVPIKVNGIRPGEKMHEVMVSDEEAPLCEERGCYYAIRPMLPELSIDSPGIASPLKNEYSSGDEVLSFEATEALLRQHGLMLDQVATDEIPELLR
jgi:UDP-glucose 4-epimerase